MWGIIVWTAEERDYLQKVVEQLAAEMGLSERGIWAGRPEGGYTCDLESRELWLAAITASHHHWNGLYDEGGCRRHS